MKKSKILFIFSFSLMLFSVLPLPTFAHDECVEDGEALTELIMMCEFGIESFTPPASNSSPSCANASVVVKLGDHCESMMYMDLYLVNILGLNVSPTGPGPYALPSDMPDIYVEYDSDMDGTFDSMTEPINTFDFAGWAIHRASGNHFVFKRRVYLNYNHVSVCGPALSPFPYLVGHMSVRMLENSAWGFRLYETGQFAETNGVMSCDIFHETCGYCDPECPVLPPVYEPTVCFDCETPCKEGADERTDNSSGQSQDLAAKNLIQKVSPNPFVDELNIQFTTLQEEAVEFSIIDIKGSIEQNHKVKSTTGRQQLQLDLSALAPGVYHCQIKTATNIETVKIVKNRE